MCIALKSFFMQHADSPRAPHKVCHYLAIQAMRKNLKNSLATIMQDGYDSSSDVATPYFTAGTKATSSSALNELTAWRSKAGALGKYLKRPFLSTLLEVRSRLQNKNHTSLLVTVRGVILLLSMLRIRRQTTPHENRL